MTTLLLIRHGQSQANLNGLFAGQLNPPLTELGVQQAQRTAEFIKAHYQVDKVYASDLSRAARTGQAVADNLGLPLKTDTSLREINAGQWEGISFERLAQDYPEDYGVWLADIGNSRDFNIFHRHQHRDMCAADAAAADQTNAKFLHFKHLAQCIIIAYFRV